jgi:nucleoid-associated protein YgaU
MTKETNLKQWALTAVLGLLLGACAHQEGNSSSDLGMEEGSMPAAEMASAEGTSIEDAFPAEGAMEDAQASGEMAPLPGASDEQALSEMENVEHSAAAELAQAPSMDAAPVEPQATETMPSDIPQVSTSTEPTLTAPSEAPAVVAPKKKRSSKVRRAKLQLELPTQPVEKKGELLNRFYVVRNGDTPERVSELMYGNKDRAEDLKSWNGDAWKTGSIVFYLSPLQPADGEMRSFYTERGMVPTEYEVKQGDTLATIAAATYGAKDSWMEIGLLNGIHSPEGVEPGRRLALFPADLSGYSLKAETPKSATSSPQLDKQIDTLETQISKLEADIKKDMPAASADDKTALEAGMVGSKPLLGDEGKDLASIGRERQKARATHGGMNDDGEDVASAEVASFFQQNLALIVILALTAAGLGVFVFIRRSRHEHDV